jgi:phage gpG-like protein
MSVQIEVKFPPASQAIIKDLNPAKTLEAIRRAMTRALEVTAGRIQEHRLSGRGPFPPALHRLGQVTQQLTRSTHATPAKIQPNSSVVGAIGASVVYAAVHEFGSRKKNIPARAPFQTGIRENLNYIEAEMEKEILKGLQGEA